LRQFEAMILAGNPTVWYTAAWFYSMSYAYKRQHIIQKLEKPRIRLVPTKKLFSLNIAVNELMEKIYNKN
jgi:hypothetical protein